MNFAEFNDTISFTVSRLVEEFLPKDQFIDNGCLEGLTGGLPRDRRGNRCTANFRYKATPSLTILKSRSWDPNKTIAIYCSATNRVTGVGLPSFSLQNSGKSRELIFHDSSY